MKDIATLEAEFENFSVRTKDIGRGIAESINMMELDAVQSSIASAVLEIERITNKTNKPSRFAAIPFIGTFIKKATIAAGEEELKSGSMVEVVDRLFAALNAKKQNIVTTAEVLYNLKDSLIIECAQLTEQETEVLALAELDSNEGFLARNLLVQVQPALISATDHVGVINATIQAAQVSAQRISAMLPQLQSGLITEMSIQAGLQGLSDFKKVFDETVNLIEDLNEANSKSMNTTLLEVVDLVIAKPGSKQIARIENLNAEREKTQKAIKQKMDGALKEQGHAIKTLANVRANQSGSLLSYTGEDV